MTPADTYSAYQYRYYGTSQANPVQPQRVPGGFEVPRFLRKPTY
jgi:hypothetical protein